MKTNTLLFVIITVVLLITTGCDTELVHESHDHNGDSIQDHTAEEHNHELEEAQEEERNGLKT